MNIEIHLIRGQAETLFDFTKPGLLRVVLQMGRDGAFVTEHCHKAVLPEILERVVKLLSDPDHPRLMIEEGRNLIIRETASV